jgi:5'-nucleotidase
VAVAAVHADATVVINEIYGGGGNSGAQYKSDFVELFNKSSADVSLAGWSLQYAPAPGPFSTANQAVLALSGTIPANDYFLIKLADGNAGSVDLPTPDLTGPIAVGASNGKFALVKDSTTPLGTCTFAGGSCSLKAEVFDYVGFGTATDYAGAGPTPAASNTTSVSRDASHANTANNAVDFLAGAPTPMASADAGTPPPPPGAATPATISEIQGTGAASPKVGESVEVKGYVTAAYPTGGLNGFVIQEKDSGGTVGSGSQAVFVYAGSALASAIPAIGSYVEVTGAVSEYNGLTEVSIAAAADVQVVTAEGAAPTPVVADWPTDDAGREALESMLYEPADSFTVTNTYDTNYYGTVGLAYGDGPLLQPTEIYPTSDTAGVAAVKADNAARAVILDDGSSMNFNSSANAPTNTPTYLSNTAPVRVGAEVTFDDPVVVDYRNSAWTLNPTAQVVGPANANSPVTFANTRTSAPDSVAIAAGGTPDIKVASFNVLNYFPTTAATWPAGCSSYDSPATSQPITADTCSGNGPRGAWDAANLARQESKIVSAINALDADVVGLMEIENSVTLGQPVDHGVSTLVAALNAAAGSATWAFVASPADLPPSSLQDVITTAIIYKPAAVTPLGASTALGTQSGTGQAFSNAREPIAQAFTVNSGSDPFLFVVNHFKSKGSGAIDPSAPDEGNANLDRVAQANALAAWVDGDVLPRYTSPVVADVFLAGDFNAYTQEKPLLALAQAGYSDVELETHGAQREYSYSFGGLSGSLDHILANDSALDRVTGTDVWNINSPESIALEYSRYLYSATDFYAAGPFRSSDHDPVVVGLTGGAGAPATTATVQILNVNDFHGRINDSTVKFAGTIEKLRAQVGDANTLFLSAGDNVGASLFASAIQNDKPTVDVLNALELAVSAVGNHEFDKGMDFLQSQTMDWADFDYLGANVYRNGAPALNEYAIFTVDGVRVAVIGVVTQETPTLVTPTGVAGLEFRDEVDELNRVAAYLKANDLVDVIVAEYHDGSPDGIDVGATLEEEVGLSATFNRIVNSTSADVDVIFTGHTHKLYAWDGPVPGQPGKTRPVVQTGSYGANVGQVVLTIDRGTFEVTAYTAGNVATSSTTESDADLAAAYPRVAAVQQLVDSALANATAVGSEPVGKIAADITTAYSAGEYVDGVYTGANRDDRAEASTLGTMVANSLRDSLKDLPVGADFGVTNPGGLRVDLLHGADGTVTFAQAKSVLPFDNTLASVSLTGAQVVTMLEQQWQRDAAGNLPSRPYLQLGLSDDINYTYTEADATCTDASSNQVDCTEGTITSVTIKGEPLELDRVYRIATFSFLAAGGDNFWVFAEAASMADTGLLDWEAFANYLGANAAGEGLAPDYRRAGVRVEGLPDEFTEGDALTLDVSKLNVPSLGAPANTMLEAFLGGTSLGQFAIADGAASVAITLPAGISGEQVLTLVAQPTGTLVTIPLTIEPGAGEEPTDEPTDKPTDKPTPGSTAGAGTLPVTGASGLSQVVGLALLVILAGATLAARRRRLAS